MTNLNCQYYKKKKRKIQEYKQVVVIEEEWQIALSWTMICSKEWRKEKKSNNNKKHLVEGIVQKVILWFWMILHPVVVVRSLH